MHFTNSLMGIAACNQSLLWDLAESYLHVGQEAYEVTLISYREIVVQKSTATTSILLTIVKVISYVIIILPLLALIVKAVYRKDYSFTILDVVEQDRTNDSVKRDISTFKASYEKFQKKETNKLKAMLCGYNDNPSGFDLSKGISDLDGQLKTLSTYVEEQEKVITTAYVALQHLLEKPVSTDWLDSAKTVFKKITAFLRTQTGKNCIERYRSYVEDNDFFDAGTITLKPSGYLELGEEVPAKVSRGHIILVFLLKQLRKQIKLHSKGDKILALLTENQKIQSLSKDLFAKAISYLSLTWLHGTKAFVIKAACEMCDGKILPAGELRKRDVQVLTGEMSEGITVWGVNNHSTSGVNLAHADKCTTYARDFSFDVKKELRDYQFFLDKEYETFSDFSDRQGNFTRMVEAIRRVRSNHLEKFEKDKPLLLKKLALMYSGIKELVFDAKPNEIFSWHDYAYSHPFYSFLIALESFEELLKNSTPTQPVKIEDKELATIGVVLASNTRYGFPAPLSTHEEPSEEAHFGELQLGKDIQVVFTNDENISKVQEVINRLELDNSVKVEPMSVLKAAEKIDRTLGRYFYDVYNLKKWEKLAS